MLGFTPFKKHANKFNYIPRYYDPEKEARAQRRAELRGERPEDDQREYRPGQYIRTQREARAARRQKDQNDGQSRIIKMAIGAVVVVLFIYMLYPKLADVLIRMQRPVKVTTEQVDGFDPSLPITIVPNDYEE